VSKIGFDRPNEQPIVLANTDLKNGFVLHKSTLPSQSQKV
jgi:hypothetical protein